MTAATGRGVVAEAVLSVLAVTTTGTLYLGFFTNALFLPQVVLAAAGGAGIAWAARRKHWRPIAAVGLSGLGFILSALPAAWQGSTHGGLDVASRLAWGTIAGWASMLSISLPTTPDGEPLVALLLITWVAGHASITLVLRTTAPLAPVVPVIAAYAVGLLMVASLPGTYFVPTAVIISLLFTLTLLRAHRGRRTRSRTFANAAFIGVLTLVVGVFGAASGYLADSRHRTDPRPLRGLTVEQPRLITPLATVKAQLEENPPRRLLRVALPHDVDVPFVRVASLDQFDGAVWTTTDDYLVAGRRLQRDAAQTPTRAVTATVSLDGLPGPFLPVVGWPTEVHFPQGAPGTTGFSLTSGSVIVNDTRRLTTEYTVTGEFQSIKDVRRDAQPTARTDSRYTSLEPAPPQLITTTADSLTRSESTPVGKLLALETHLRGLPYNVDTPPGHSYAAIRKLLSSSEAHEDEGYAEQHASAFAVMARTLRYPARVAVGYSLHDGQDGVFDVTTRDVHAWAEVQFDGYGWVAFDPTDHTRTQRTASTPLAPIPTPTPTDVSSQTLPSAAPPSTTTVQEPPPTAINWLVVWVTLGSLVVGCAVAVVTIKAWRRRRRRRADTPHGLVIGAWEEALDRLTERSVVIQASRTPNETARDAVDALGSRAYRVAELAPPVTTAIFGPSHVTEADALNAWATERRLRRELDPGWRRLHRLVASFDPRPLFAKARRR